MWLRRAELRRILDQVKAAEHRALAAESALAAERRERMADVRHVLSQWLRHQKAFPLPKTVAEKEEAKATEQEDQPSPLTDVQLAMRDANRIEAARFGISKEDADADFERSFLNQMME